MKILQFHNKVPYPPKDGGAIGIWNFSVELAAQENNLILFCINTNKHFFDIQNIPKEYTSKFKIEAVFLNTDTSWLNAALNLFFSKLPYNAQRFISRDVETELIRILKENTFDVIQIEGLYCMPYLPIIRKHSKALISFKSHNIEHEIWERVAINTPSLLKKMYLKMLAKRIRRMEYQALQQADVNITVTKRDADSISKISSIPVHVAPAGISLKHTQVNKNNTKFPSLFFLGALDWAPNQEGILWFIENVWPQLIQAGIACPLEVAGRNCPDWLEEKLHSIPQLIFHGEVDDAYEFMNERAIMLVPLFSGSGMRVKIIEGMALGKAIISTSIGAEGISTKHNENIFIADDATSFAQAILELTEDRTRLTIIGNNARSFALQNYDISNIVTQLTDFWKKQLSK